MVEIDPLLTFCFGKLENLNLGKTTTNIPRILRRNNTNTNKTFPESLAILCGQNRQNHALLRFCFYGSEGRKMRERQKNNKTKQYNHKTLFRYGTNKKRLADNKHLNMNKQIPFPFSRSLMDFSS